ncbi:MAG TPA: hypothetical protein VIL65_11260 [Beijerinckiaceae bacterium]|jgi:hypothetical protein
MIRFAHPCPRSVTASGLALAGFLTLGGAALAQTEGQQPRRSTTPARTEPKPAPAKPVPAADRSKPEAKKPADAKPTAKTDPKKPDTAKSQAGKGQADKPGAKPDAKADPKKAAAAGPGGAQAATLGTFGDWTAYSSGNGRAKLCYALTQPKDRQPKTLQRDAGYLFVSFRPAENVRNEVAVVMGFPTKDGGAAEAVVGTTTYALITKDRNAWVKNPAEEPQVIATMSRGQSLVVKAASIRGNQSTDRYSLNGFGPALERARKECS